MKKETAGKKILVKIMQSIIVFAVLTSFVFPGNFVHADTVNTCVIPGPTNQTISVVNHETVNLQMMLTAVNPGLDMTTSQKNYDYLHLTPQASSNIEVQYLDNGGGPIVFGYYTKDNPNTFVPIFKNADYDANALANGYQTNFQNVPLIQKGDKISVNISGISDVSFAIKSSHISSGGAPLRTFYTQQYLNDDGFAHSVVYETPDTNYSKSYLVAFEDMYNLGDHDYNDIFVRVNVPTCGSVHTNTPPTISLVGTNPISLTVGQTFVDPGATATDLEDGNLTSAIVKTGTVNTAVVGTTTLTYAVTDSGGLSASVTRTVIVNLPAFVPPTVSLSANPTVGTTVPWTTTLTWTSQNAGYCEASNGWSGFKNATGTQAVQATSTTTFTLRCFASYVPPGINGWSAPVSVTVTGSNPPPPPGKISYPNININLALAYTQTGNFFNYVNGNATTINAGDEVWIRQNTTFSQPVRGTVDGIPNGASVIHWVATNCPTGSVCTQWNDREPLNPMIFPWSVVQLSQSYTNSSAPYLKVVTSSTTPAGTYMVNFVAEENPSTWPTPLMNSGIQTFTIIVRPVTPPTNHPPVITLLGANPFVLTVGQIFADPGATSTDIEDGNLTSAIVKTGTVNTAVVGTTTLTYTVTDSGGLSASVTRTVIVNPVSITPIPVVNSCSMVSDTTTYIGTANAVPVLVNAWNSNIAGATWIWLTATTSNPNTDQTVVFEKDFYATSTAMTGVLQIEGDNIYTATLNGVLVASSTGIWDNYSTPTSYNISSALVFGTNRLVITVTNRGFEVPTTQYNPAGLLYRLDLTGNGCGTVTPPPANHPPVITLVGANPLSLTVGTPFIDPGATATDTEDGVITNRIIASSTVNTNISGTYNVLYTVTDSGGLSASTTRTVIVNPVALPPTGQVSFCLMLADNVNAIATSSLGLPAGTFTMNLGTTTSIASSTVFSRTWDTSAFVPNQKVILSGANDAHCVTVNNLPMGVYYYSPLSTTGTLWNTAQYNSQETQSVNNVFDFFPYATGTTTNQNANGVITITSGRLSRTVVIFDTHNPIPVTPPQCLIPQITSQLSLSTLINQSFNYTITASSTSPVTFSVASSSLPTGLSFSGNSISGTPSVLGTFNIPITATANCGATTTATLILTVTNGGGGGGGSSANIAVTKTVDKASANVGDTLTYTITIINNGPNNATGVKVIDTFPTELNFVSATSTLGTFSTSTNTWTIGSLLNGSSTSLTLVATVKSGTEGKTFTNTAIGSSDLSDPSVADNTSNVNVTVNTPVAVCTSNCGGGGGGGGNPPGNGPIVGSLGGGGPVLSGGGPIVTATTTPNACYYLFDYLRKDLNNNPIEVKKLQVFLRDLEGFTDLKITGVYDDATIVALDEFQNRYKGDILTPWGHNAPTGYTYILTKKKVNEIYCKRAFPVTEQQQAEIDAFRNFLLNLQKENINIGGQNQNTTNPTTPIIENIVGVNTTNESTSTALAVAQSTSTISTNPSSGGLLANVFGAGKNLANAILGVLLWPFTRLSDTAGLCTINNFAGWLNLILLAIIIIIGILWYREYRNNKKLDDINKQIDLN